MTRTISKTQAPVLNNIIAQAVLIKAAATLLIEEAGSEIVTRRRIAASIRVLKSNGDCLAQENAALFATNPAKLFTSIYEREDLRALTSRLEDILEAIEETAFRLSAYEWAWLAPSIPRFCGCLKTCAEGIHSALDSIAHGGELPSESLDIQLASSRGDAHLEESIRDLFSGDCEGLTIFTNREICIALYQALSFCNSAVKQLLILESSSA